ncbi:MAG: hypothetical protein KF819_07480 [Labilithrix sp.]|nr:hypothetical protein [Labilithrix sp.]
MKSSARRALAVAFVACAVFAAAPARAQSEVELKAARELFQEAYKDEQDRRFAEALEKFQRVARVKESASVRYRIAAVLDALGRLREARDAFRALAASRPQLPASEQEIADSAAERAHALDKRIPRLVLSLQDGWPEGTRVMVDGGAVAIGATPRTVEVDPGDHVVQASAPQVPTSESKVSIAEGSEASLAIAPTALRAVVGPTPPPAEPSSGERPHKTLAWVAIGAGGALVVSSVALLAARESNIGSLERRCPGGACPAADRARIESIRDDAKLFGPLGVGLGIVGLAAVGAGAYLLLRPATDASRAATSRSVRVEPRMLGSRGAFLGVSGAF